MTEPEVLEKLELFKNAIIKLKQQLEDKNKELAEMQEAMETSLATISLKDASIKELEEDKERLEKIIEELTAELESLKENSQASGSEFAEKQKNYEEKISNLEKEISDNTEKFNKELESLKNNLESKVSSLEDNNNALKEKVDTLNIALLEKDKSIEQAKNENEKLVKQAEEAETLRQSLRDIKNDYKEQVQNLENANALLKKDSAADASSSKNTIRELRANIDELEKEKQSLHISLNMKHKEVEELEAKIKQLEEQLESNAKASQSIEKSVEEVASLISEPEKVDAPFVNGKTTVSYKFANTTPEIMDKVQTFIDALYDKVDDNVSVVCLNDPQEAAAKVDLSPKQTDAFIQRLCTMKVNGKPLIFMENGCKSYFKKDWLQQYISIIVK